MRRKRAVLGVALIVPTIAMGMLTTASAASAAGSVTSSQARETALARTGGGQVLEGPYKENEHGRSVWCVNIRKDNRTYDVDVSRSTGKVVEVEVGDGGDDD